MCVSKIGSPGVADGVAVGVVDGVGACVAVGVTVRDAGALADAVGVDGTGLGDGDTTADGVLHDARSTIVNSRGSDTANRRAVCRTP